MTSSPPFLPQTHPLGLTIGQFHRSRCIHCIWFYREEPQLAKETVEKKGKKKKKREEK